MPPTLTASPPRHAVAGDTIAWRTSLTDYPSSDGWTLSYAFRLQHGSGLLDLTATPLASDYNTTISAASSNYMTPGVWVFSGYVTKLVERYQVQAGTITLTPNLATIDHTVDLRSPAKLAYDNAMEAWQTFSRTKMTTLNGRTYTARDASDLIKYVDRVKADYAQELQHEQFAQSGFNPRKIGVRLTRV